ncbi:MAG: hypothetical protein DCC75_00485 [Proteobacteria bacterium]|nr:MAG: hypothetical protein DCC75_00485 [Pseudomonadota bacterium]
MAQLHSKQRLQSGFTLMEVMIALAMLMLVLGVMVSSSISLNQHYFNDIVRTKIKGNLRGAVDIISMNIRQAGENLSSTFPAILLTNGNSTTSDVLTLRRSLVTDVLTLCTAAGSGTSTLYVSNATVSNAACMAANISASHAVFEEYRADSGGSLRIYIYDQASQLGEFLDFTGSGQSGGEYYLATAPTTRSYPVLTSYIYMLEEYRFQLDLSSSTLNLYVDGQSTAQAVAFETTGFDVLAIKNDGTQLTEFENSSTQDWKDLEKIRITLTGQHTYHGRQFSTSVTSEYFPRNIMSYEG